MIIYMKIKPKNKRRVFCIKKNYFFIKKWNISKIIPLNKLMSNSIMPYNI